MEPKLKKVFPAGHQSVMALSVFIATYFAPIFASGSCFLPIFCVFVQFVGINTTHKFGQRRQFGLKVRVCMVKFAG
jgi:hypothetical protein